MKISAQHRLSWQGIILVLIALVVFSGIVFYSSLYFRDFNTSMLDLGNISQAIWNASQGNSLVYTAFHGQNNRLNGHAEVIFFLFAPVYSLFPHSLTLITIQALIFILGTIPVYRMSERHLESKTFAMLLSIIYLLYPVALTGVLCDIHGDTLAMPLLLFVLDAADRNATTEYLIYCMISLTCKSYVIIPVLFLAIVHLIEKKRKLFLYTLLLIIGWEILFYAGKELLITESGLTPIAGLSTRSIEHYFQDFLASLLQTTPERLLNGLIAIFPSLLLGIFAIRKALPGILILIPVLISTGPGPVYRYTTHHYGFIVPFLIAGMIFGASALKSGSVWLKPFRSKQTNRWKGYVLLTAVIILIFDFIFLPLPFTFLSRQNKDIRESFTIDERDKFKTEWLIENVLQKVPIMSDTFLASHLTNREVLYRTTYLDTQKPLTDEDLKQIFPHVDFLVFDIFSPYGKYDLNVKRAALASQQFGLINARDGLLLFGECEESLNQNIYFENGRYDHLLADFNQQIGLVESNIEKVCPKKYSLSLTWTVLGEVDNNLSLYAVSRVSGIDNTRIVHLPSLLIYPIATWEQNQMIHETVVFELPEETGEDNFDIYLGLYDYSVNFITAEEQRIGDEVLLGSIIIEE
jgi:uncharacterized membrane protein